MAKRLVIFHTNPTLLGVLADLCKEILPGVELVNLVDDSLLPDVRKAGQVTTNVRKRICTYVEMAEAGGADVVLNSCSSVSEVIDLASQLVTIPVIKIDQPMAEKAVDMGHAIGVIATVPTTVGPTTRLIERCAAAKGKTVQIEVNLCSGAFDALMAGDTKRHDQLVLQAIEELAQRKDAVVLAQGSMARLVPQVKEEVRGKVLSSPRLGLERVKEVLSGH